MARTIDALPAGPALDVASTQTLRILAKEAVARVDRHARVARHTVRARSARTRDAPPNRIAAHTDRAAGALAIVAATVETAAVVAISVTPGGALAVVPTLGVELVFDALRPGQHACTLHRRNAPVRIVGAFDDAAAKCNRRRHLARLGRPVPFTTGRRRTERTTAGAGGPLAAHENYSAAAGRAAGALGSVSPARPTRSRAVETARPCTSLVIVNRVTAADERRQCHDEPAAAANRYAIHAD